MNQLGESLFTFELGAATSLALAVLSSVGRLGVGAAPDLLEPLLLVVVSLGSAEGRVHLILICYLMD